MKAAAKEGYEDAFVDTGNGVYILDGMKLDYLKGLKEHSATDGSKGDAEIIYLAALV